MRLYHRPASGPSRMIMMFAMFAMFAAEEGIALEYKVVEAFAVSLKDKAFVAI